MIANLAFVFALHTLFADSLPTRWGPVALELPVPASVRPVAVGIAVVAAPLLFRLRWSVLRVLGACAVLGLLSGMVEAALA